MPVDLHTHSSASDGELDPLALVQRAHGRGVRTLALTDHDTVAGVCLLQRQRELPGALQLVPGVEISAAAGSLAVHVVGLWVDTASSALDEFLHGQGRLRAERGQEIARRLGRAGLPGSYEGALELAGDAQLSRPHFARFLVAAGHCSSEQKAFRRWLGRGKPADVRCEWPDIATVNATIHAAGGIAVLAHPLKYRLSRTRLDALLGQFRSAGGDALELVSGAQPGHAAADLLRLATKHQLACSTGSDFHSPKQTWCDLGGQPDLPEQATTVWDLRA